MEENRIIITIRHGHVVAVHADERAEVHVIDEDKPTNGDAAYVAGLKYQTEEMIQVYPGQRKPKSRPRFRPPQK